jgi:hypothetical protein
MLAVWLHLLRPRRCGAGARLEGLAGALLEPVFEMAARLACGNRVNVLGDAAFPVRLGAPFVQVSQSVAMPNGHDPKRALAAIASDPHCSPDDDILLLSPFFGAVTWQMTHSFLERSTPSDYSVGITPIESNEHPSWLLCLDDNAGISPGGGLIAHGVPHPIPIQEMFDTDTPHCLTPCDRVLGSQWLPKLYESTGALARCPGWLPLQADWIDRSPTPVAVETDNSLSAKLHTLFKERMGFED